MSADIIPSAIAPLAQEDTRDIQAVKRFNKSFDQQIQHTQQFAMVQHSADCDVISCRKTSCFKWEPDTIIGKSYKVPLQGKSKKLRADIE